MESSEIALYYKVFFLFIEPLFALLGAICAGLYPGHYFAMTEHLSSSITLVLRVTTDHRVWRMLLLNLAIADIGHLISIAPLGVGIYSDITRWNSMDWGNVPFVYLGLTSRICFLMGWGVRSKQE